MWVQNGVRVDSTHFSDAILRPKSAFYFGASLGVQDFRQLKTSMVREFIPPSLHIGGGNTTADESLNHSRLVGVTHYGLVDGDLPHLTQDTIWEFRAYDEQWFNFCGIGTQPPQQPLRLQHQPLPSSLPLPSPSEIATASPTAERHAEEVITRIVDEAVNSAMEKSIARAFRRMEREILDDIVPVLVESALDAAMRKLKKAAEDSSDVDYSTSMQHSSGVTSIPASGDLEMDVITISSEDVIEISSGDEEEEDLRSVVSNPDSDYEEDADFDTDGDDGDKGKRGGGGGGEGRRGGGGGGGWRRGGGGAGGGAGRGGGEGSGGVAGDGNGTSGRRRNPPRNKGRRAEGQQSRVGTSKEDKRSMILKSIHAFDHELLADSDSSLPPTPSPLRSSLEERAREGIRRALRDPTAMEKSPEQLELLVIALANEIDAIVVMGTGGGKSLAWDATALVEPGFASIVMVPYAPLLDQHLKTSLARNIVAAKYTVSSQPPANFQILFIQPETGKTTTFKQ
jgi:hypothetical protein